MSLSRTTVLFIATLALAGCSRDSAAPAAPASASEPTAGAAPTNRIDIPAAVRSNLGITFTEVQRRRVESTIRMPGAFELQPLARQEHRMTLPGRVQLEVDQYQRVAPGDLLYRFQSPRWSELQREIIAGEQKIGAARAAIDVAQARLTEAEQRLSIARDRLASLSSADIRNADLEARAAEIAASLPRLRAELKEAQTRLANAKRTREHALRRASVATGIAEDRLAESAQDADGALPAYRTIDWIEVRATEPGVVERLAVTDGSFVEPPSLVVATVDPSKVRFRAMALQSDLVRLRDAAEARIAPPATPGIPIGDAVDATVTIGLEAHPEQRTVTLLATPDEPRPWIRPGVSAFLEVVVESTGGPALAIPRAAIVQDGITHVFFRRDPQDANKAIRVEADMGVSDGRWVEIKSGLAPGDEVVLDGPYELKLASQQSGIGQEGGHFHADGTFHGDH